MAGRLVFLATSPRVPAGLLTCQAWQALRDGRVLTAEAGHPLLPFLADVGIAVGEVPCPDVAALAADLVAQAAEGPTVVWLSAGEADAGLARAAGKLTLAGAAVELELLLGSYDLPGSRLLDVVAVMDRLRSPGGCPWDAEQTHASLAPYLLEEAYEAYQAIEDGDPAALREELGDVLLQVAFHARVAQEHDSGWDIDDVAADLVDKLVRRHPHVFAAASAHDSASVEASWDQIKAAEKGRASVTEGVPMGQPALALAAKLQRRAERLGVPDDVFEPDGPGAGVWREVTELRRAGEDPEAALRSVARDFRDRLAGVEAAIRAEGGDPAAIASDEWGRRWHR
ncbi:MAG: MazG family protein [Actinomycetota bacterium]|nr:MazG family protein [Actinomycetota bacterium]